MTRDIILAQTVCAVIIVASICTPLELATGQIWVAALQIALDACCITSEIIRLRMIER